MGDVRNPHLNRERGPDASIEEYFHSIASISREKKNEKTPKV